MEKECVNVTQIALIERKSWPGLGINHAKQGSCLLQRSTMASVHAYPLMLMYKHFRKILKQI